VTQPLWESSAAILDSDVLLGAPEDRSVEGESFSRRYSFLASAIAGRRLDVRVVEEASTYTDGWAIYVSEGDDDAKAFVALVVQAALVGMGSLDAAIMKRLWARRLAARRYLTLEADRAIKGCRDFLPPNFADAVCGYWQGQTSTCAEESLRRSLSTEKIPEAPALFGVLRPRHVLGGRPAGTMAPTEADRMGTAKMAPQLPELDDDEDTEGLGFLRLLVSTFPIPSPLSRLLQKAGAGRAPKPDGGTGGVGEMPVAANYAADRVGRHARVMVGVPIGVPSLPTTRPAFGKSYPEWDWEQGRYRPNWCRVAEYDPEGEGDGNVHPSSDPLLRRKLARLGLGFERHNRQPDGDRLDLSAVVDFVVATATGEPEDERVYENRLRTARDLGVLVLLDASGSTADRCEQTEIWDEQRRFAADLVMGLQEVGDRVAAYGFNSWGRQHVRFYRIKDFDGRFDQAAVRRLMAMEPAGYTRMGAAVRHAVHLVATKAGTSKLLLVVISDGFPYEEDYEGPYAERDTHRALGEAGARGVGCVCLSVASSTDADALNRLWGNVPHARVEKAHELARHVEPLFRVALRNAVSRIRESSPAVSPENHGPTGASDTQVSRGTVASLEIERKLG
jgi:Mg-chelatase subunit ChlD